MSGKAENLKTMAGNGFHVPRGFSIGNDVYQRTIQSHVPKIQEILRRLDPEDAAENIRREIFVRTMIDTQELAKVLRKEIEQAIPDAKSFAVRSSGSCSTKAGKISEDSASISLAGQFSSYLNVTREKLPDAVLGVWASLFNPRSIREFSANLDDTYAKGSRMSVVVQEYLPARSSVVMMGRCPLEEANVGVIEATHGPCEAIVAGLVTPDLIRYDRTSLKILDWEVGAKEETVRFEPFSQPLVENRRLISNQRKQRETPAITKDECQQLIQLSQRLEELFGGKPQDVEAIFLEKTGELCVLQSRDVTTIKNQTNEKEKS